MAAVVVVGVLVLVSFAARSNPTPTASVPAASTATSSGPVITMEVTSTTTVAGTIGYSDIGGYNSLASQALPWSINYRAGAGMSVPTITATLSGAASNALIRCRILRDGAVISINTSAGSYATVLCSVRAQ